MYKTLSRNIQRRQGLQALFGSVRWEGPGRKKHRRKRRKLLSVSIERQRRRKSFGFRVQPNVTAKDLLRRVSTLAVSGTLTPDEKQSGKSLSRGSEARYPALDAGKKTELLRKLFKLQTFERNQRKRLKAVRHKKSLATISGGL